LVSPQYYRDPEATSKAFRGGSFRSGDLAVMHPDGTVSIVDRSKDIIISGGEVSIHIVVTVNALTQKKTGQNASSLSIEQGVCVPIQLFFSIYMSVLQN
jgi:non-ribosomal peptide synthetase component E (peptide arylation enzyme)